MIFNFIIQPKIRMSTTKILTEEEFNSHMKEIAKDIDADFLKKSKNTTGRDTEEQKKQHDIDVCVVQYQSEGYLMGNPVHWCGATYYISEKFEKDGIRFKIFIGNC